MSQFVSRHQAEWEELSRLVHASRKSARRLTPEDLARLDVLYRQVTVHLAQVTTRSGDVELARYLNDLTAAAHALIYLPPRQPWPRGILQFIVAGFAILVARSWRYHAVAAALVLGGAVVAYFLSVSDPLVAYALLPPGETRLPGSTPEQLEEALRSGRDVGGGGKFFFASFLFSHNLKVGLVAMGLGILAGVPTILLLAYNGMILGAFAAVHYRAGIVLEFWAWVLPHGVTEILAIILCGGVGLSLGHAAIRPGLLTRAHAFRLAGNEAARMVAGVAGMLVVAAMVESYLRQSHLSSLARLAFAAASAVFWILYFAHGRIRLTAAQRAARSGDRLLETVPVSGDVPRENRRP